MPSLAEQAQTIANLYQPPSVGRPSDLGSESTVKQFLEAVGDGNYVETAAKLAGLSKQVVYNWIKRGQSDEPGNDAYRAFVDALEKAEARAEAKMLANVRRASELPQFWAAGMTVLERRHPERWSKRQDDSAAPKVVVNIGVGQGDVRVGIALSPPNINDLACGNQGQVEMLSPINSNYVNQLEPADGAVPPMVSATGTAMPAVESAGGPYPGGGEAQSAVGGRVRQRRSAVGRARRKKASGKRQDGAGTAIG